MSILNLGTIILTIVILGSNGQELCQTLSGPQGKCVSLIECTPLLELLKRSQSQPQSTVEVLQKSQCGLAGTTPKVCCPSSTEEPTTSTLAPIENRRLFLEPGPPEVRNHPNLRLLDNDLCGGITESKIFRGTKTTVLEFPWMALIAYNFQRNLTAFNCGGTLINKRYVLTAAHCVTGLNPGVELSGVRIGEHDLSKAIDCDEVNGRKIVCAEKYQNFFFESFHYHNKYNKNTFENDIALIRLDGDADFKPKNVRPICLPIGDAATLRSNKVIVTGWGRTEKGRGSVDLLKVTLDVVPTDRCDRVWRESNRIGVNYKQICAGGTNGMDSCAGDSGGPLQYPEFIDDVPKYIQYGVVSFGTEGCGINGYPGVYTKIVYYMDWILNTMHE